MISRPLVTGWLLGLLSGQPKAGLFLGLSTELLWLAKPPLGGLLTPNGGLAVSAAFLAYLGADQARISPNQTAILALAWLFVIPLAYLAAYMETLTRKLSCRKASKVEKSLFSSEKAPLFMWHNLQGLIQAFMAGLVFIAISGGLVFLALRGAAILLPERFWSFFTAFGPFAPLAGLLALSSVLPGRNLAWYISGLALGLALLFAFQP
jgi:PTS system mannose-specific IIC component